MEEEGTYSRVMNFVKEFGVVVLLSTVFRMGQTSTPKEKTQENEPMQNELQNEEDEDDDESSSAQSNSLLSKFDETAIESLTSSEEIREA